MRARAFIILAIEVKYDRSSRASVFRSCTRNLWVVVPPLLTTSEMTNVFLLIVGQCNQHVPKISLGSEYGI